MFAWLELDVPGSISHNLEQILHVRAWSGTQGSGSRVQALHQSLLAGVDVGFTRMRSLQAVMCRSTSSVLHVLHVLQRLRSLTGALLPAGSLQLAVEASPDNHS